MVKNSGRLRGAITPDFGITERSPTHAEKLAGNDWKHNMGRLTKVVVLLALVGVACWYALQQKTPVESFKDGPLHFLFDPTERFDIESKKSWVLTVAVIVVASGVIAL